MFFGKFASICAGLMAAALIMLFSPSSSHASGLAGNRMSHTGKVVAGKATALDVVKAGHRRKGFKRSRLRNKRRSHRRFRRAGQFKHGRVNRSSRYHRRNHRRSRNRRYRRHSFGYLPNYGYGFGGGYGYGSPYYGYPIIGGALALSALPYAIASQRSYRRGGSCSSLGTGTRAWSRCCSSKYKSFNRRTGRYLAYSGKYRRCR